MVILHNAIKTIQNRIFVFFWKKNKKLFLYKKYKTTDLKKTRGLDLKKNGFFSTLTIFQSFFMIFPWSHDLEQVASLSVK